MISEVYRVHTVHCAVYTPLQVLRSQGTGAGIYKEEKNFVNFSLSSNFFIFEEIFWGGVGGNL